MEMYFVYLPLGTALRVMFLIVVFVEYLEYVLDVVNVSAWLPKY